MHLYISCDSPLRGILSLGQQYSASAVLMQFSSCKPLPESGDDHAKNTGHGEYWQKNGILCPVGL